jgi:hypothetical protein
VALRTNYPELGRATDEEKVSDELIHERLEGERPLVACSTLAVLEKDRKRLAYRRMGPRSRKRVIDMANGAVTGLTLKDVPNDPPKLDTCPSCALAKAQRLPFTAGAPTSEPLELIQGDMAGPMPVESVIRCK